MEPDYFITESGVPDILLPQRNGRKFGVTDVKKFQHKNKERCNKEIDVLMNVKSMKNLQNERLKQGIEEERQRIAEREENLEQLR